MERKEDSFQAVLFEDVLPTPYHFLTLQARRMYTVVLLALLRNIQLSINQIITLLLNKSYQIDHGVKQINTLDLNYVYSRSQL